MARPNRKPQTHETASQTSVAAAVCPLAACSSLETYVANSVCPAYVSSQHSTDVLAGKSDTDWIAAGHNWNVSTVPLLSAEGESLTIRAPLNASFEDEWKVHASW